MRDLRAPVGIALNTAFADDRFMALLADWMSVQRWYAGKGRTPHPRILGSFGLTDTDSRTGTSDAAIRVLLVLDEAEPPKLYQLPLTVRRTPDDALASALVGTLGDDDPLYLYDGPHDPTFARALLRLILEEGEARNEPDEPGGSAGSSGGKPAPSVLVRGHATVHERMPQIIASHVLAGEQSNTSIVYELADAAGAPLRPVICKLFRTLHHGENPDVVLLDALGAAGSRVVPQPIGHVSGQWGDTRRPDGVASGHLAFAQEYLPGVEDAWKVSLRNAEEGRDFTTAARALGEATAEVHEALARTLATRPCTSADIDEAMASMRRRLALAIEAVPELAGWRSTIEAVYARAAATPWPELQRIHGDLHLGQVLAVPGRGWVLIDFEGEPLRPMSERCKPDFPLRDVAGMLRSFDYVAGASALAHPAMSATDWALACRRAFVDGYSARSGNDLRANRVLLDAFEIDKAVYEAIYEARNRPDWLPIPVAAITRLAERASGS